MEIGHVKAHHHYILEHWMQGGRRNFQIGKKMIENQKLRTIVTSNFLTATLGSRAVGAGKTLSEGK